MAKNKSLLSFLMALAVCQFVLPVLATPTTHIWAPSTDVQPFARWHITADVYVPVEKNPAGRNISPVTNLGLTVGVLPDDKFQMEIGFDHKAGLETLDNSPFYFNLKAGIPDKTFGNYSPAVAVGIFDVGTEGDRTNNNVLYVKLAKSFVLNNFDIGRFSLGYFRGNPKLLLDKAGHPDNKGFLVAWERTLKEVSDKLWVCVEYMGSSSSYGSLNFGFSWKFSNSTSLLIGYNIYSNSDLPRTLTVQTDIDF